MKRISVTLVKTPVALGVAMALHSQVPLAQEIALEEVLVTATRRDQSVQDIPYNIDVVTADQLRQTGVSDIANIVRLVPGLSILNEGPRVSGNRSTYNLRGLNVDAANNNDDNPGISQATVSTYLGEVPVFFPLKLVDLSRVEVLRGPQGTLYGASSVGGTVRFIPERPQVDVTTVDVMAELSQTEGAGDLSYDGHATLNLPLSPTLAFRGTAGRERLAGFIDAVGLVQQTGTPRKPGSVVLADPSDVLGSPAAQAPIAKDANESEQNYLRASLRWLPNDVFEATANFNWQEVEAETRQEHNPFFGDSEDYKTYKAFNDPQDSEISMFDLDVQMDLGFARLTSATGYSEVDVESISDSSGFLRTNLPQYYFGYPRLFAPINRQQENETFTQELRLVSQNEGSVDWVAGVFYMKDKIDFLLQQEVPGINEYTNLYFGLPEPVNFTDVLATGGTRQTFEELAAFAEVTWHVNDRWQITGGVRVFDQELDGTSGIPLPYASRTLEFYYYGTASDDFLLGGINPTNYSTTDEVFKLNTSYDLSDDMMLFATAAQGFRPGGANQLPEFDPFGNDNRPFLTFEPDDVKSYEIGLKGEMGSRFRYTATAFFVDWSNFQATLSSSFGVSFVDNVPGAESKGIEVEVNGFVTERMSFSLGYTYVDATISEAFEFREGDPATTIPDGNRLPGVAETEFFAAANYRLPLQGSTLAFHSNVSYRGDMLTNFRDLPTVSSESFAKLDDFTLWNATIVWEKDNYSIGIFGENLTDELGAGYATTADFYGERDQGYGVIRPRTFGARLTWQLE